MLSLAFPVVTSWSVYAQPQYIAFVRTKDRISPNQAAFGIEKQRCSPRPRITWARIYTKSFMSGLGCACVLAILILRLMNALSASSWMTLPNQSSSSYCSPLLWMNPDYNIGVSSYVKNVPHTLIKRCCRAFVLIVTSCKHVALLRGGPTDCLGGPG
jgi:hypothetical protein